MYLCIYIYISINILDLRERLINTLCILPNIVKKHATLSQFHIHFFTLIDREEKKMKNIAL